MISGTKTKQNTPVAAPTHPMIPPVNAMQSAVPAAPSGCAMKWENMYFGDKNRAVVISATARLRIR